MRTFNFTCSVLKLNFIRDQMKKNKFPTTKKQIKSFNPFNHYSNQFIHKLCKNIKNLLKYYK